MTVELGTKLKSVADRIRKRTCCARKTLLDCEACHASWAPWLVLSFVAWSLPSAVAAQTNEPSTAERPTGAAAADDEWGREVEDAGERETSDAPATDPESDSSESPETAETPKPSNAEEHTDTGEPNAEPSPETFVLGLERGPSLSLVRMSVALASSSLGGFAGAVGGNLGGTALGLAVPRYFIPLQWAGTFGGASAAQVGSVYAVGSNLGGPKGVGPALATTAGSVAGLGALLGIVHYNNSTPADQNIHPAFPVLAASAGPVVGFEVANLIDGPPPSMASTADPSVRVQPTGSFDVEGAGGMVGVHVQY